MRLNSKKMKPYLVVILPLATLFFILSSITSHYIQKITLHVKKVKEKEINGYVKLKGINSKIWVDNMIVIFEKEYEKSLRNVNQELEQRINTAYKYSLDVKKKYEKKQKQLTQLIISKLSKMNYEGTNSNIFLVNYDGDTLLGSNSYKDINGRSIILEEIQTARKLGSGFITSKLDYKGTKRYLFVRDLKFNKLFIGVDLHLNRRDWHLKQKLLEIIKNTYIEKGDYILIFEDKKVIYSTRKKEDEILKNHSYSAYFKELDWNIVYNFDISKKVQVENQKEKNFKKLLE